MYSTAARHLAESLTIPTPRMLAPPQSQPLLEVAPPSFASFAPQTLGYAPSLPEARAAYRDAQDWHRQSLLIGLVVGIAGAVVISRRRR